MRTIPQRELRNDSAAILAEVAAGATIQVTSNSRPMAVLVPPQLDPVQRAMLSGSVRPAGPRVRLAGIPRATRPGSTIGEALDDLRGER